eukprot:5851208-Ditylum_brightwellii.AAC.1
MEPIFQKLALDTLNKYLDVVTIYGFPSKAYNLSDSLLPEFPTSSRVTARKMNEEELLEVLEN